MAIQGVKGRIVADQHAYKIYRRETVGESHVSAWKTVYITDIAQPVRMYVRGNEFTRQIDYFIDSICQNRTAGISGFESGMEVDRVIEEVWQAECKERTR